GPLDETAVKHLFRKRLALEFQELKILFHAAIERKANLPGPREDFGIFDRCFVHQVERTHRSVTFHYVKLIAVIVSRAIEPSLLAEPCHVDNQRSALPPAARPAHPRWDGGFLLRVHADDARGAGILVGDEHVGTRRADTLHDSERIWQGIGPRPARHGAFHFQIAQVLAGLIVADVRYRARLKVFFLFGQRFGAVWNFTAFDDTLTRGSGAVNAVNFR